MRVDTVNMHDARASGGRLDRRDLALCAALLVLVAVVCGKGLTVGGPRWGDAGTHVMDGVLIYDWVCAGPAAWIDPVGFAERQYSHYPSLGIGSTYPPGFAVVEAAFFAVFGVSVITSRLCVLTFALAAFAGLYVLLRRFADRLPSACVVLSLLVMPSVVHWTRQTMLETPTLALLIWSAVAAYHYYRRPTWARLTCWVLLSVAAVMFKQTAVFILAPHAVLLIAWTARKHAPLRHVVAAGLGSTGAVAAYCLLISSQGAGPQVFDYILDGRSVGAVLSAESWLTYARWLPDQAGWWVLLLGAVGFVVALRRWSPLSAMMLLWFVSFTVMSGLIQHKQTRYFFFGLLPIAVWAGLGAGWALARLNGPRLRLAGVTVVTLLVAAAAYRYPISYRPDYGPLVLAQRDQIVGHVVLFDGHRDSDFILAVRQHLGRRKCVVLRASKLLYACAAVPKHRFESFVQSAEQVDAILKDFAFDSVFVERHPRMNLAEERLLRASLSASSDYALAASHTLRAGPGITPSSNTEVDIDVYLPRRPMARRTDSYQIPIPMDNRVVSVNLDDLLADPG